MGDRHAADDPWAAVTAALVAIPAYPAAALSAATAYTVRAAPGGGGGLSQEALASWIRMDGNTGTFYVADGMRSVDGEPTTLGGVAKGTCDRTRAKNWVLTLCTADGVMKEIPVGQFSFDPLLRSASLTVDARGDTHTAEWTAKGAAQYGQESAWGEWGAYAAAGRYVAAPATGSVFGKDVAKGCSFCLLVESAGAVVFSDATRDFELTRDGDAFTVRLKIRERIRPRRL